MHDQGSEWQTNVDHGPGSQPRDTQHDAAIGAFGTAALPPPGPTLQAVQQEWDTCETTGELFTVELPRPWHPANCTTRPLKSELEAWLTDFVSWYNSQCTWDPNGQIPDCWTQHPHLVHDIANIADQYRRAHDRPSSDAVEQWNRLTVPSFVDRMRAAIRQHCADGHQRRPA